ncbi:D-sedoheptulose-7-phosphate isomerase [Mailhella sp.]|uniref:D-sedoheptulose-7-phosphate isomerase n=1 Tax=Mailhella sp. TaxID=1981029 RepID=UPI003AB27175
MKEQIEKSLEETAERFRRLRRQAPILEAVARAWIDALKRGNKIMFCGNGGSAADSQHLAAELMGRYKFDRRPLPALSLTTDTSALTAIGNDYGYENVFSRQLRGLGVRGDVLVGISTSGNSRNVLEAFAVAREMGVFAVAFTGESGGRMKDAADLCLAVPSSVTNSVQEMHIACGHLVCGIVEAAMFPEGR